MFGHFTTLCMKGLNSVREEKSLHGIVLYRALENHFVTKMCALLVNFIFNGFRAFENIVVSTFVVQLKNR